MTLQLSPCTDPDFHRLFTIISNSFSHDHAYIDATFPSHATPTGTSIGAQRFLEMSRADPNTIFLKVVDTSTDTIVGVAKWNIYKNTIPEEVELEGDYWESDEDKEYAQLLFREFLIPRRDWVRKMEGNLVSLDILAVDPEHQYRGAGRMLVKWGTKIADELGFVAVVEASDQGRHLYEQEGFEVVERYGTRLPEKWEGVKRKQEFLWMVRPAKKET